jgi:hypothetical protein
LVFPAYSHLVDQCITIRRKGEKPKKVNSSRWKFATMVQPRANFHFSFCTIWTTFDEKRSSAARPANLHFAFCTNSTAFDKKQSSATIPQVVAELKAAPELPSRITVEW